MSDIPVVVLGNGPVGQTTALLLARWGVPTIVLDQRDGRDVIGSKAICQQQDVLDIWAAVGAGRRIADEGVTWTTARTFYRDREMFARSFQATGRSSFPPWVNISQARTEQILDECVAAQPLIEARWAHRVTGLRQDADGVTVHCATPAGPAEIRAGYAVACLGARGEEIRRVLGVSFDGHSFDDRFLICDIRAELPGWERERRFYFDPVWNPGRQVLIHPCPDSTYRIDWQVPSDYDLAAEEADGTLDRRIRAIIGDARYQIVWKSVYRFHSRVADRLRVGRVLLAGDCAHLYAPFGARGLNSGVADAENLAWKLAFVLAGRAGEALLASYHTERHAAAVENLAVTGATMRFLVPQDAAQARRRTEVLAAACADPARFAEVDSGRFAEPFWYTESPLTTPDPGRPFAGRPPWGRRPSPGPGVLLPDAPVSVDGRPVRLRELARSGFLLLTTGPAGGPGVDVTGYPVPVRVRALDELDPSGALAETLGTRPGEVWLIRPDAHIAAVLAEPDLPSVRAALDRALGGQPLKTAV